MVSFCIQKPKHFFFHVYIFNMQCMMRLLMAGSVSCLLLTGASRMCHFYLVQVLSKCTTCRSWLHLASSRLLLETPEVQFQTFLLAPFPFIHCLFVLSIKYLFFIANIAPLAFSFRLFTLSLDLSSHLVNKLQVALRH